MNSGVPKEDVLFTLHRLKASKMNPSYEEEKYCTCQHCGYQMNSFVAVDICVFGPERTEPKTSNSA